jgi:hypothetical protein
MTTPSSNLAMLEGQNSPTRAMIINYIDEQALGAADKRSSEDSAAGERLTTLTRGETVFAGDL